MRIKLPHDETDSSKRYLMPDPDALADGYERAWRSAHDSRMSTGIVEISPRESVTLSYQDLTAVLSLAGAYLDLTTGAGQERSVGKLRDIWRARRARECERLARAEKRRRESEGDDDASEGAA